MEGDEENGPFGVKSLTIMKKFIRCPNSKLRPISLHGLSGMKQQVKEKGTKKERKNKKNQSKSGETFSGSNSRRLSLQSHFEPKKWAKCQVI